VEINAWTLILEAWYWVYLNALVERREFE